MLTRSKGIKTAGLLGAAAITSASVFWAFNSAALPSYAQGQLPFKYGIRTDNSEVGYLGYYEGTDGYYMIAPFDMRRSHSWPAHSSGSYEETPVIETLTSYFAVGSRFESHSLDEVETAQLAYLLDYASKQELNNLEAAATELAAYRIEKKFNAYKWDDTCTSNIRLQNTNIAQICARQNELYKQAVLQAGPYSLSMETSGFKQGIATISKLGPVSLQGQPLLNRKFIVRLKGPGVFANGKRVLEITNTEQLATVQIYRQGTEEISLSVSCANLPPTKVKIFKPQVTSTSLKPNIFMVKPKEAQAVNNSLVYTPLNKDFAPDLPDDDNQIASPPGAENSGGKSEGSASGSAASPSTSVPLQPGKAPGENKPGDQKSGDEKSSDQKPGENKLGENKPGEDKPGAQNPGESQTGENQPGPAPGPVTGNTSGAPEGNPASGNSTDSNNSTGGTTQPSSPGTSGPNTPAQPGAVGGSSNGSPGSSAGGAGTNDSGSSEATADSNAEGGNKTGSLDANDQNEKSPDNLGVAKQNQDGTPQPVSSAGKQTNVTRDKNPNQNNNDRKNGVNMPTTALAESKNSITNPGQNFGQNPLSSLVSPSKEIVGGKSFGYEIRIFGGDAQSGTKANDLPNTARASSSVLGNSRNTDRKVKPTNIRAGKSSNKNVGETQTKAADLQNELEVEQGVQTLASTGPIDAYGILALAGLVTFTGSIVLLIWRRKR